jgi:hypothetical protein
MPESGQGARGAATGLPTPHGAALERAFAALGAACALVPALAMWGFTVDDALIPVRYAHNLATGAGYRFDAQGPSTDGVTPLPWAFVLALLSSADPLTTLVRAKVLGVVAWTLAGAALGARAGTMRKTVRTRPVHLALGAGALVVMGLAFPLGAWAASGMETGLSMALATVAVTRLRKPMQVAALAGAAASLRPEMVVWAATLALGASLVGRSGDLAQAAAGRRGGGALPAGAVLGPLGVACLPFALCAAVRLLVFGRMAPLAVVAKPSDLAHGVVYVGAATVVVLLPLLAFAPVALARSREARVAQVVVIAFVAHALAVLAAGGDWMPYARLMVPVAPSLVLAFVDLAPLTRPSWSAARLAVATALGVTLALRAAPAGRGVQADRDDLVVRARPVLAGARVVAALDIGWVSAATPARIVDLAGLTDPAIALLPGGHTSKRVDVGMLLDRGVDTVVVYSAPRQVEARLVRSALFDERFVRAETLALGARGASYTLYRRRP